MYYAVELIGLSRTLRFQNLPRKTSILSIRAWSELKQQLATAEPATIRMMRGQKWVGSMLVTCG